MSRLHQFVVASLVAVLFSSAAAQGASAAVSDAAALSAIRAVLPAASALVVNVPSHDGTRAAVLARRGPDANDDYSDDLWLVGPGTAAVQLTDYWAARANFPDVTEPVWSTDDRWLTADISPNAFQSIHFSRLWSTSNPRTPITITDGTGGSFSADGRYALFGVIHEASSTITIGEAAVDLASGRDLVGRWATIAGFGEPRYTYAPECARSQQPGWKPASSTGRWMEDALAGPDPGCRFGANETQPSVTPTPSASPVPAPTTEPSVEPSPSPTPTPQGPAQPRPTPTPRPATNPLSTLVPGATPASSPAPLPPVDVTSVVKSLSAARSKGLRLRLTTRADVALKAYAIVAASSARAYRAAAGASATLTIGRASLSSTAGGTPLVTIKLTSKARRALRKAKQLDVTIRVSASTSAGPLATIERPVRLSAR